MRELSRLSEKLLASVGISIYNIMSRVRLPFMGTQNRNATI